MSADEKGEEDLALQAVREELMLIEDECLYTEKTHFAAEERLHRLPPLRRRLRELPFGLDHPVWVNDETATVMNSSRWVVDTVNPSDAATPIGEHWERHPATHHLRELNFLPDLVAEAAIRATGQNFGAH